MSPDPGDRTNGILVLITGTGRSGTSTMSGTLHHLGLYVPGPHLGANESNPKGFYESRWAVKFHDRLNERAGINAYDSRPGAFALAQAAITPQSRERLEKFLAEHAAMSDQVVVKDPRSVWVQALWREAAATAGLDIRYITMLRHPAETVGSRTTYYAAPDPASQHRYGLLNVARWVNNSLISERETRGFPRAFVHYTDLLADWRAVAGRIGDQLGLRYDAGPVPGQPHPVDEFIDPELRRHQFAWEDVKAPRDLEEIAEGVWEALGVLAAKEGIDQAASDRLDALAQRFEQLMVDTNAINLDTKHAAVVAAQKAAAEEVRRALDEVRASAGIDGLAVGEVGGRDLLKVLVRRVSGKLSRRKSPPEGR
jgi:hypothetical protein